MDLGGIGEIVHKTSKRQDTGCMGAAFIMVFLTRVGTTDRLRVSKLVLRRHLSSEDGKI